MAEDRTGATSPLRRAKKMLREFKRKWPLIFWAICVVAATPTAVFLALSARAWFAQAIAYAGGFSDPGKDVGLEGYSGLLNVGLATASLIIAYALFRQSEETRRQNRRAEVIISCIERYNDISTFEAKNPPASQKNKLERADHFYSRLFALQSDQLDFYLSGWVDADTFVTWMRGAFTYYVGSRQNYGMTIREGWSRKEGFHKHANNAFFQMMSAFVFIDDNAPKKDDKSHEVRREAGFRAAIEQFDDGTRTAKRLLKSDFTAREFFEELEQLKDIFDHDAIKAKMDKAMTDAAEKARAP